jgi:2,4-dienoyl-CoA reductase-like NADH-dependent reductase (Old Yellow Enzyme family)
MHYHTNTREDDFGGTPENMARFPLQVIRAMGEAVGFERVGLRLSPGAYLNQIMGDERDAAVFRYLLETINQYPLAYVHTGNFNDAQVFPELGNLNMTSFMRQHYKGHLIACGSYTFESAQDGINNNLFDLVAMGRPFIANPDLIDLFKHHLTLKKYDVSMLTTLF